MENTEDKLVKSYTIEEFEKPDGSRYVKRTASGFNGLEILGLFEVCGADIRRQIFGQSDLPHIKERIVDTPPEV